MLDVDDQVFPSKDVNFEIIVVDNNSTDSTKMVVNEISKNSKRTIRYIFERKQGISFARNRGLLEANGELIAFTDDDCIVSENWLFNLYNALVKTGASMVGGRLRPLWQARKPSWLTERSTDGVLGCWDLGEETKEIKFGLSAAFPHTSNLMFKTSLIKSYGYFNTDLGGSGGRFRLGSEDMEFGYRMLANGEKIVYTPHALVMHPVSNRQLKKSYFRWRYFNSGREATKYGVKPCRKLVRVPLYLYRELAGYLFKALFFLLKRDEKKAFFYEIRICYIIGYFLEFWFINSFALLRSSIKKYMSNKFVLSASR